MNQTDVNGKYRYLAHPADIKIQSYGKTLEEAISHMVCAMSATYVDVKPIQKIPITVRAPRLTSTLFDFFSQVIVLNEVDGFSVCGFDGSLTRTKDSFVLTGNVLGEYISVDSPIKAVTYHDISVETKPTFSLTFVFDI